MQGRLAHLSPPYTKTPTTTARAVALNSSSAARSSRGLTHSLSYPNPLSGCQDKHGKDRILIRKPGKLQGFLVVATNKKGDPFHCHMCRVLSTDKSNLPGRENVEMPLLLDAPALAPFSQPLETPKVAAARDSRTQNRGGGGTGGGLHLSAQAPATRTSTVASFRGTTNKTTSGCCGSPPRTSAASASAAGTTRIPAGCSTRAVACGAGRVGGPDSRRAHSGGRPSRPEAE